MQVLELLPRQSSLMLQPSLIVSDYLKFDLSDMTVRIESANAGELFAAQHIDHAAGAKAVF